MGVSHSREIPCVRETADCPSTSVPSDSLSVECERRRRDGHDLSADGEHAAHLTDRLLEIAVLHRGHRGEQQVPDGMTPEGL